MKEERFAIEREIISLIIKQTGPTCDKCDSSGYATFEKTPLLMDWCLCDCWIGEYILSRMRKK